MIRLTPCLFTIWMLLLLSLPVMGQTLISGKLLDADHKPIPNVSVSYRKIGEQIIRGYTKTDAGGAFKLAVKNMDADSLQLDFNHLSYAKKSVTVANRTAAYTYTLKAGMRQLEEVKVADIPIFKRGDTINYSVSSFTSKNDRVIGDIIRKLPGIEMLGDRILYQGTEIQQYKVNNLDLMEGRYSIINKNLPADAVKNVQVVENDQPIKVLDSIIPSDKATLNLELKKFTTTGSGKAAGGLSPGLWALNLTPMVFGKTFQMLSSFQTNNTGDDVAKQLRPFYTGKGYFSANESMGNGPSYISIRNVATPGFDEKKWLDNQIFLFTTNVLQKLKSGLELKGNVSYYDDTRKRQGFTATQYFTADETILNTEGVDNDYRLNALDGGVLVEKNEKEIYLRNRLLYHKHWNRDLGDLLFNEREIIAQRRTYTDEAMKNAFTMARFWGKQLVHIRSTIEWHRTPQRLTVVPGQFEDILNNGDSYDRMEQRVVYSGFAWDNGLKFTRKFGRWTISPDIAFSYYGSKLHTGIDIVQGDQVDTLGAGYLNDMDNDQWELAFGGYVGWEYKKWKFSLTTPYHLYRYHVQQQGVSMLDGAIRQTFTPSVRMTFSPRGNHEWNVSVSGGNQYGGLDNFYDGYIIGQYRSIQRYDVRLLRTDRFAASTGYNYKNTLRANFVHLYYTYGQNKRDYIFHSSIDSLGRSTVKISDRSSGSSSHSLNGGISHFFSPFKTVVKLNAYAGWSRSDYLLNEELVKQHVERFGATLEVINSLSSDLSVEYKISYGHTRNAVANGRTNRLTSNNHYLNLVFYPWEQHALTLSNAYYHNNITGQRDQYFLDATYRYQLKKWKTDLELTAQNLLDNSRYVQQFSSDYELVQSYFELRPRQFLVSVSFRF